MQTLRNAGKELLRNTNLRAAQPIGPRCPACGYSPCACRCPGCDICGGSGYVRMYREDGPIEPCPNYTRRVLIQTANAGKEIGGLVADEVLNLSWDMVKAGYSDGVKARDAVKATYEHGSGLVLLFGTYGQAKTLTMKIAVAQALRDGKKARYAKLTQVLDDIRLAYDEKESMMSALLDRIEAWRDLDLLALDEMDKAAKNSDWATDRIFNLIDDRYVLAVRGKSITLTAGNWQSLNDLNGPFGYFRSRIEDNRFNESFSSVVYLNGTDGRKVMPQGYKY